ncbi:sensor histidine kinase [Mucilaginibacter terrae]|uniref:histidine kinase n=1 Tax=Mucilaginibacter terrae TaxID=1955052 RepID=A0ABU3GMF3_9SPHI|nr:sensor histidine kinase [Mucilaginibacter terrae]MDT3400968.1 two-component sensor histidine kinase [Mucilaginibacter terrae]
MPNKLLQLILLLALSRAGYAQMYGPPYAKQLKKELSASHNDSTRVRLLYNLGEYYFIKTEPTENINQFNRAIDYFNQALTLSEKLKLTKNYNSHSILCRLGDIAYLQHKDAQGSAYYKKAVDFYTLTHDYEKAGDTYAKLAYNTALIGRPTESFRYWKNAQYYFTKANNIEKKLDAQVKFAMTYLMLSNSDSVKILCERLINDHQNSKHKAIGLAYRAMAKYYRYKANFNKALYYAFESENWTLKTGGDIKELHSVYGEFAQIYQALGQTDKSIVYYKKTLELRNKLLMRQDYIFRTAGFLIQQLIKKNKQAEGLAYLKKLELDYGPVGDAARINIAQAKAYCFDALKQYKLAEKYYKEVVDFYSNKDAEIYYIALFDFCKFLVAKKDYDKAATYLSKTTTDTGNVERVKDLQLLLYKVDSAQHNYHSAVKHLLRFQVMNDSIFNATKNKQIEELNIKYETEQQLKNISALKKETQLQRDRVNQADKIKNLVIICVVILLLFVLVLYHNYRLNKRNNLVISRKNQTLNQLITEKEWLLKEVHHRVKNNLQIVMGLLQRQSSFIDNEQALAAIRDSEHRMHSIALIHQKLYQSESYMVVNMVDYINELVDYLKESFDLGNRITFEKQIDELNFGVSVAVPIGLILNEAITNAIKYAFGHQQQCGIHLILKQTGENDYLLQIADNGEGLPPGFDLDQANSMGFNLIRGLCKQIGGKLDISNQNGVVLKTSFHLS